MDELTVRLMRRVAEAADAWLTDPLDVGVYGRLVEATQVWRAHAQPMLEGTERTCRRRAATPDVHQTPAWEADTEGNGQRAHPEPRSLRGALEELTATMQHDHGRRFDDDHAGIHRSMGNVEQ